jgi:LacI family transcriptional regulator
MNLRQLSSLLDLSQTTVSRALNGFPEVSEETRNRVKAAAELHGYRPSAAARRLATGQSGTLGVVFPAERNMLGDLLFTEFLEGCVEKASELGYDIMLAKATDAQSEEDVYRRSVNSARVDGMIVSTPYINDQRLDLLESLGLPYVLHGRTQIGRAYPHLDIDNEGAFFKATEFLTGLGHTRIALLNGETKHTYANDRFNGYARALALKNLPLDHDLLSSSLMLETNATATAERLLRLGRDKRPTAFLCSSMSQASGVIKIAKGMGLVIGTNISVIAHDDRVHGFRAEDFSPQLTATQSAIGDAGRRIVELLIHRLRNPDSPMPAEVWPVDLVVRSSTGPAS